jgi:hypothetical protein
MMSFCDFFARSGVGCSALVTNDSTRPEASGILMARLVADFVAARWSGESPLTDSLTASFCAEPDADFGSEADKSESSPSAEAPRLRAEVFFAVEDLLRVDEDVLLDDEVFVAEDVLVDDEPPVEDDEPDGSAYAIPGVVAMATPTPRVTASAPTRPMCLA